MIGETVSRGLGKTWGLGQGTLGRRAEEWSKVGQLTHTQQSVGGAMVPGKKKAEDVVIEAADPKPGKESARQRYREGAGRRMVREPECDVIAGEHQTATGLGRQKPDTLSNWEAGRVENY